MFLVLTHTASWLHEFEPNSCIWLSIVPFHRCDVCDVTLPLTHLPYVTRRHNNVNPLSLGAWRHLWMTPICSCLAAILNTKFLPAAIIYVRRITVS